MYLTSKSEILPDSMRDPETLPRTFAWRRDDAIQNLPAVQMMLGRISPKGSVGSHFSEYEQGRGKRLPHYYAATESVDWFPARAAMAALNGIPDACADTDNERGQITLISLQSKIRHSCANGVDGAWLATADHAFAEVLAAVYENLQ